MPDEVAFPELIRRVRSGDQAAAAELVQRYEPAIRRSVRLRLVHARLGPLVESMDICQSVLAGFFVRAAAGQFEIDKPEQLLNLLVTMAHNKLTSLARKQQAQRRNHRRVSALCPGQAEPVAAAPGPYRQLAAKELLQEVYRRLSAEELQLVELRNDGHDWAAIAARLGSNPVLLRKRLSRALDRVTRELGLDEESYE